jgi:hypothetical protein
VVKHTLWREIIEAIGRLTNLGAQILARLNHPHIAKLLDGGTIPREIMSAATTRWAGQLERAQLGEPHPRQVVAKALELAAQARLVDQARRH